MGVVHYQLTLRCFAQGGDHQVGLAGLQIGDPIGADHGNQLDRRAQLAADIVGHVNVQALRCHVFADKTVGRVVGRTRDPVFFGFGDGLQRVLRVGGQAGAQQGGGHKAQGKAAGQKSHGKTPGVD